MTRKQVELRSVFEFNAETVEKYTDEELIEMAKESFYTNGGEVTAVVVEKIE